MYFVYDLMIYTIVIIVMPGALHDELLRVWGKSKNDLKEILKMYHDDHPNDAIHLLGRHLTVYVL